MVILFLTCSVFCFNVNLTVPCLYFILLLTEVVNNIGDSDEAYPRSDLCAIRDIWVEMRKATYGVLESMTLQDLVERQRQKWDLKQLKYHKKQNSNGSGADLTSQMRNEKNGRRERG